MTNLVYDSNSPTGVSVEPKAKPGVATGPLVAIGWVLFLILLAISPALVWAGWKWLT
jgi:hypothetical protein